MCMVGMLSMVPTATMHAVARTTAELQHAQWADPAAALLYERQPANQPQPDASPQLETSPVPPSEHPVQAGLEHESVAAPHTGMRDSGDLEGHETEDTDAPVSSAGHSKPVSLGWGRLKKVKLAAHAEGSQDVGSKRRHDQDTGICTWPPLLKADGCSSDGGLVVVSLHCSDKPWASLAFCFATTLN